MKNLEAVLQELTKKKIEGVNSYAKVNREMQDVSWYSSIVTIVYNNRFILGYNHDIKGFVLSTTYSNQVIDGSFMEELNVLNQAVETLNKEVNGC